VTEQRVLRYEPSLDGLRAVSVLGVVLFHACATSSLGTWFRGGGLGVSVFFTLSGFLITSLLVGDVDRNGTLDLRRFWGRRIRRLAPTALVVVLAVLLLSTVHWLAVRTSDVVAAVWSFTNWHVIGSGQDKLLQTIVGPLGPTWSLAVEEQFYVVLAVLVAVASRTSRSIRTLVVVFTAMVPISILCANAVSDWGPRLEFGTDVRAGELAVGGLLALGVRRWGDRVEHHRASLDIAAAAGVVALITMFLTADYSPPWLLRGGFTLVAGVSAIVILGALAHGVTAAALSSRQLVALGRASYSIYLVHWPIILVVTSDRVGVHGWVLVAVKVVAGIAIAFVLHLTVEQPLRATTSLSLARTIAIWLTCSAVVTVVAWAIAT
jgi:peptidoglycan/LPS O-acetylase OafA/YrhL